MRSAIALVLLSAALLSCAAQSNPTTADITSPEARVDGREEQLATTATPAPLATPPTPSPTPVPTSEPVSTRAVLSVPVATVAPTAAPTVPASVAYPGGNIPAPRAVTATPVRTAAPIPTPATILISALCNPQQPSVEACATAGATGVSAALGVGIWASVVDWNAATISVDSGASMSWAQFYSAFATLSAGKHSLIVREPRPGGVVASAPYAFTVIVAPAASPAVAASNSSDPRAAANAGGGCFAQATAAGMNPLFRSFLCVEDDSETVTVLQRVTTATGYSLIVQRASGGRYLLGLGLSSCQVPVNARVVIYSPNRFGEAGATIPAYGCTIRSASPYFG